MGSTIPLKGRSAVVPAGQLQSPKGGLYIAACSFRILILIARLHISEVFNFFKAGVGHAQFIAVVVIRSAPHGHNKSGEHLGRWFSKLRTVVTKPADQSRLVVVGEQISPDPNSNGTPQIETANSGGTPAVASSNLPGNGPGLWSRIINRIF